MRNYLVFILTLLLTALASCHSVKKVVVDEEEDSVSTEIKTGSECTFNYWNDEFIKTLLRDSIWFSTNTNIVIYDTQANVDSTGKHPVLVEISSNTNYSSTHKEESVEEDNNVVQTITNDSIVVSSESTHEASHNKNVDVKESGTSKFLGFITSIMFFVMLIFAFRYVFKNVIKRG